MDARSLDGMPLHVLAEHVAAKRRAAIASAHFLSAGHSAVTLIDSLSEDLRTSFEVMKRAIEDLDQVRVKREAKSDQRAVVLDLASQAGKIRDTLCVYGFEDPGEPPHGLG